MPYCYQKLKHLKPCPLLADGQVLSAAHRLQVQPQLCAAAGGHLDGAYQGSGRLPPPRLPRRLPHQDGHRVQPGRCRGYCDRVQGV